MSWVGLCGVLPKVLQWSGGVEVVLWFRVVCVGSTWCNLVFWVRMVNLW